MPISFTEETANANQYIRVHTPQNRWRIVNYEKEEIEFDVSKGMAIDIKNVKFGDAKISNKHSNFFINEKNASFDDMFNLINFVRDKVKKKTGIKLDLEVKILK